VHISGAPQLVTAEELDTCCRSYFVIISAAGVSGAECLNKTSTSGSRGWVHLHDQGCLLPLCGCVQQRNTGSPDGEILSSQGRPLS